ncbi:MAG: type IV pili methyl-accepting chemotaxis transducer N-terminal domain-containing protein [Rhodobacteraceae bacterium]|nr:type IV pili methyl-accepting chemotaxis transducer N-terminal domain-containing protein [Paracoccaceae bacterium]
MSKMMNIQFSKRLSRTVVYVALALSISAPFGAQAQSLNANEAKTRLNIAGRERMLIQRVVKSACFSSLGIERMVYRSALVASQSLFVGSLNALQNGDSEFGLSKERSATLLEKLADISSNWTTLSTLADRATSPEGISTDTLANLDALGLDLLDDANSIVQGVSQIYGEQLDDLPLIISISIDIAGRQRMLTQKMAKEFCLIDAGVAPFENRSNLTETMDIFNTTLVGLQNGLPGMVIPAPNYDIRHKLREVASRWVPIEGVLRTVANGGEITDDDRAAVVNNMEAVLKAMNEAVQMYEYINAAP